MRGWCCRIVMGIAAVLPIGAGAQPSARSLPGGFVHLREIDPSIRQDMRYASANNFTGDVVNGYQAPECILTLKTAQALARAQALLAGRYPGHVLKVYDCYRPVRAVKRFMAWTNERGTADGNYYHPSIPRGRLVALGYIAAQSGHSRGHVVDITIEPAEMGGTTPSREASTAVPKAACTAPQTDRDVDGSLDMGTAFDCFDSKSNTLSPGISTEQLRARRMLLDVMTSSGFENFYKEWWHFSFPAGDAGRAYDFVVSEIQARGPPGAEGTAATQPKTGR